MLRFAKPLRVPTPAEALSGRSEPLDVPPRHFVKGNSMQEPYPPGMAQVVFGMGCFWGAERKFWTLPGVYVTAVGYAGGSTANPSYEEVCSGMTGHTEVVRVVFDPSVVSFERILEATARSRRRSPRPPPSTSPRATISSTSRRTPAAIAASAARASPARPLSRRRRRRGTIFVDRVEAAALEQARLGAVPRL